MKPIYPKHLYEPVRIKIATNYLKQELRKFLPSLRGSIWKKIDSDIEDWPGKNPNLLPGLRDFWNGFHGIAMGFKLKNKFIQFITAENVAWRLEKDYPLGDNIASGGGYPYISDKLSGNINANQIREFFNQKENKKLGSVWRKKFTEYGKSSEKRENFPIVAIERESEGKKVASVHDGNRRLILAILQGRKTIPAYIGKFTDKGSTPKNFWLPSSFLMELVTEGELVNDYEGTLLMLKKLIRLSKSGEYELKERVLVGQNEFRTRLRKALG